MKRERRKIISPLQQDCRGRKIKGRDSMAEIRLAGVKKATNCRGEKQTLSQGGRSGKGDWGWTLGCSLEHGMILVDKKINNLEKRRSVHIRS